MKKNLNFSKNINKNKEIENIDLSRKKKANKPNRKKEADF
jgi:hypothetical protein